MDRTYLAMERSLWRVLLSNGTEMILVAGRVIWTHSESTIGQNRMIVNIKKELRMFDVIDATKLVTLRKSVEQNKAKVSKSNI